LPHAAAACALPSPLPPPPPATRHLPTSACRAARCCQHSARCRTVTKSSLRDECNGLIRHANLVLRTLAAKHASLSNVLPALLAESGDYVKQFVKATSSLSLSLVVGKDRDKVLERVWVEIVRWWFAAYVILRDRFVLLESGKQRHDHDNNGEELFPSRMKGVVCSDGYTCRVHQTGLQRGLRPPNGDQGALAVGGAVQVGRMTNGGHRQGTVRR
jgi:hypothetical protein